MEITARDLSRLIELNKKKAELEFKRTVFSADTATESALISSNASEIASRMKCIEIAYPNQKRLDELGKALSKISPIEMKEAIKQRSGPAYQILTDRGVIVKTNFENRLEIAKLCLIASRLIDEEKRSLFESIRCGAFAGPVLIHSLDEPRRKKLVRIIQRCGIRCSLSGDELKPALDTPIKEVRMEVSNRCVWVDEDTKPRLEENLRKLQQLNTSIQLKNALRQVNSFSDDEEKGFATLQKEYLDLLKQQDELLKDFNEEEKF